MPDERTLQMIRNLFSKEPENPAAAAREIYIRLLSDDDADCVLAFLGAMYDGMRDDSDAQEGLYFLMAEVFQHTNPHDDTMYAYAKRLLHPPKQRERKVKR